MTATMPRSHRVAGALIGSAVGDALGAPFEFGPAGQFSARFPSPARGVHTEMCGGGALDGAPGEFTDDTRMALLVATSLVERGGLDEADLLDRFRRWPAADPLDVGNGSLMRTLPAAIWFARSGQAATMDAARRISALTHGDPAAGEGCAVFSELIRVALDGGDPLAAVPSALALVAPEHRDRWATALAPDWAPELATDGNGAVWTALAQALWAVKHGRNFAEVMRRVIDLGGDTDTVAAIAGGLAGAECGIAGIPMRWTSVVHGRVPGFDRTWRLADLQHLAAALDGSTKPPYQAPRTAGLEPREVADGVWAADLDGARSADPDFAVVSLCRTGTPFGHDVQRYAYLTDDDANTELDAVLDDVLADIEALRSDGRRVLVHCHAGRSRTGLVLRAWLRRSQGLSAAEATAAVRQYWPHLSEWNATFTAALERAG